MPSFNPADRRSARLVLALLIVLPFLLLIGREFTEGRTIGYFRVADLADILIMAPLYTGVLLYLWFRMQSYGAPRWLLLFFIVFTIIFLYGNAIHFTGNSINTFITEVNDYEDQLPPDVYDMIFLLDEQFSHVVLFTGSTGLIAGWLMFDQVVKAPPLVPANNLAIAVIATLYGVVQTYTIIEARTLEMAPLIAVSLAAVWIWLWRRSGTGFWEFSTSRPFTKLVPIMLLAFAVAIAGYGLWHGGFPEPGEVGL